jgi:hypothetical protein
MECSATLRALQSCTFVSMYLNTHCCEYKEILFLEMLKFAVIILNNKLFEICEMF